MNYYFLPPACGLHDSLGQAKDLLHITWYATIINGVSPDLDSAADGLIPKVANLISGKLVVVNQRDQDIRMMAFREAIQIISKRAMPIGACRRSSFLSRGKCQTDGAGLDLWKPVDTNRVAAGSSVHR